MNPYLIIAICVIAAIIIIFFISFVINRKTPKPKGCENIKISEDFCLACSNTSCRIHQEFDLKRIKDELENESEEDNK